MVDLEIVVLSVSVADGLASSDLLAPLALKVEATRLSFFSLGSGTLRFLEVAVACERLFEGVEVVALMPDVAAGVGVEGVTGTVTVAGVTTELGVAAVEVRATWVGAGVGEAVLFSAFGNISMLL